MKSEYFDPIDEQTEINIWECFGKSKNDVKKDIEALKVWLESQPHLPKYLDDRQLRSFLIIGRGSVEKIKPKIDFYFTMRSIFTDIFNDSHPSSKRISEAKRFLYLLPLPTLCKQYSRTLVFKLKEVADPHNIDFSAVFAYIINMVDIRLIEDFCSGHTVVFDLQHCKLAHCANLTPTLVRNSHTVGEKALTTRVHGVHIINAPKYSQQVLFLVKSIVKPKLASKIYVHQDEQSFLDAVDKSILPKDYGGDEKCLDELEEAFCKKYEEYKSFFDLRETFKVNEDLRPTKNVNDEILGFYGNFKKLDVD